MHLSFFRNRLWKVLLVLAAFAGLLGLAEDAGRAEAAASHELNYFKYETFTQEGRKWLRLELGIKGGSVEYATSVRELTPKQLHVVLSDTARGHNGLMEKTATLAISKNVADILRGSGAVVTMTRDSDKDVYGPMASDRDELQARVDVGNASAGNEIFVSIHCDAFTSPTAHGTSTFYYQSSHRGRLLAEAIHQAIVEETGLASRGAKTARFYVLRNSAMPATLIETAFISNYQEEALLGDPDFQYKLAVAICRGISQYFKMR